ncbi:MAG: hypothetical protein D3923_05500 [Candidatus Electrothrix sp. AR3]|nr:hypothetical protein [Candidatus Electrothrix sp. AR3]
MLAEVRTKPLNAAKIAVSTNADLLILISDIAGLYSEDPTTSKDAILITELDEIPEKMLESQTISSCNFQSTGGLLPKLRSAKLAIDNNIYMVLSKPYNNSIFKSIVEGEQIGTVFLHNHR